MGTNYYVEEKTPCPECGSGGEKIHIGKSSAGWCFALHVHPDLGLNDLAAWREFWRGKKITDEYGDATTEDEMIATITTRRHSPRESTPFMYDNWDDFHKQNNSQDGPNNLIRSKIDGRHCVGHGDGTWDLFVGEFS
jgi:hypothetical protein